MLFDGQFRYLEVRLQLRFDFLMQIGALYTFDYKLGTEQ